MFCNPSHLWCSILEGERETRATQGSLPPPLRVFSPGRMEISSLSLEMATERYYSSVVVSVSSLVR